MSKPAEKQEWFQVAEAFEASGLTQKEFSTQRGCIRPVSDVA
ncbi:hypothetical protein VZQ01_26795 [Myxococcus faecalis]